MYRYTLKYHNTVYRLLSAEAQCTITRRTRKSVWSSWLVSIRHWCHVGS